MIKQKMSKNDYKKDTLPPPPHGKSTGHGLICDFSFSVFDKSIETKMLK